MALFDTYNAPVFEQWMQWLNTEISQKTQGNVTLSEVDKEVVRKASGGWVKGSHKNMLLRRASDDTQAVIIFAPGTRPVEVHSMK